MEDYAQMCGRAGRDGNPATAIMCYREDMEARRIERLQGPSKVKVSRGSGLCQRKFSLPQSSHQSVDGPRNLRLLL